MHLHPKVPAYYLSDHNYYFFGAQEKYTLVLHFKQNWKVAAPENKIAIIIDKIDISRSTSN